MHIPNNISIEQFPTNIIAAFFNFNQHKLLTFEAKEIQDINVKNLFLNNK